MCSSWWSFQEISAKMKAQRQTDAWLWQTGVKIWVFFFYYFWLLSCFTSTNTWLHSRKNTLGALHRDAFGRVMLRNMTDGFQTKSKFEERVAERVAANDGWSSQLLQHTELVKHHTGRKCKKRKQLAEKHTMSSRLRWGECAVTSAEMPRSFGR